MGRTKIKPRYNVISFRVADDELVRITEAVVQLRKHKGDLAREMVLAGVAAAEAEGWGR